MISNTLYQVIDLTSSDECFQDELTDPSFSDLDY